MPVTHGPPTKKVSFAFANETFFVLASYVS